MKYERKHQVYESNLFRLWYERYYPENQPEYKKFKRAINKSRIINILGIQLIYNLLLIGIKQYVIGVYFSDLKESAIIEMFRDTSWRMIIVYAIIPSVLLNVAQGIMNHIDKKRGQ